MTVTSHSATMITNISYRGPFSINTTAPGGFSTTIRQIPAPISPNKIQPAKPSSDKKRSEHSKK